MSNDLIKTMWESLAKSPYLMVSLNNTNEHSEPMRAQLDEKANDCFWFFTKTDNRIAEGGQAMAQFASLDHTLFACISGALVEETNQDVITRYWSKPVEAWYEKGRDDRSLLMMRFELKSAEMWKVDPSVVGMIKLTSGSNISPEEMGEHQKITF